MEEQNVVTPTPMHALVLVKSTYSPSVGELDNSEYYGHSVARYVERVIWVPLDKEKDHMGEFVALDDLPESFATPRALEEGFWPVVVLAAVPSKFVYSKKKERHILPHELVHVLNNEEDTRCAYADWSFDGAAALFRHYWESDRVDLYANQYQQIEEEV